MDERRIKRVPSCLIGPADKDAGPRSCLTPGACGGWLELLERYGTMTPAQVFAPAIDLAENGYAVTVRNSQSMSSGGRLNDRGERVILSRGRGPLPGEIIVQKDLARDVSAELLKEERRFFIAAISRAKWRNISRGKGAGCPSAIWRILNRNGSIR